MEENKEHLLSQMNSERKFGQSAIFVTSTLVEQGGVPASSSREALLKEAIHVMSCDYEDKTEWGTEVIFQLLEYQGFYSYCASEHFGCFCVCSWVGFMAQLQKIY